MVTDNNVWLRSFISCQRSVDVNFFLYKRDDVFLRNRFIMISIAHIRQTHVSGLISQNLRFILWISLIGVAID